MANVNAQTATALCNQMEHIERIAHNDFIDTLAASMPYLLERREVARKLVELRNPYGYEIIQSLNKELAKIFLITYDEIHQLNKKA